MNFRTEAEAAAERLRPYIRETPVEFSPYLSQLNGGSVNLKLENFQVTGSFKFRGAMNKLLALTEDEKREGVVTASSGNHGLACAYAFRHLGISGTIYLPENASSAKVDALRMTGADLKFHGADCAETELFARENARGENKVYVSPYNDLQIIAGQATVGVELARQCKALGTVLVPVGGGGLLSGIAGYLKSIDKKIEIVGCQPENSAVMYESIKAGRIVEVPSQPTISDGTAGGIESGAVTFDICRRCVDDFVLVTEDEIKAAIKLILEKHHMLIEGAAALSVACFLKAKKRFEKRTVVLVLSGAKLSLSTLREVLST